MRLSIINFAGIARTLVAVGTESDASIDATTRPATPRIGSIVDALGVTKTGAGLTCACAGVGAEGVTCAAGAADVGVTCAAGAGADCVTGAEIFCAAFGTGGVPPFGADAAAAGADATGAEDAAPGV